MEKKELLQKFDNFVKSLKKSDNIGVAYHADGDGMASCLIIDKAVFKLLKKRVFAFPRHNPNEAVDLELINELKEKNINKLIITDLSADTQKNMVEEIAEFARVLIIDHHKIYEDLNSANILFIKAQFIEEKIPPESYPASKMAFDLFSRHADLRQDEWIALLGLKADVSEKHWNGFISKAHKKFPDKLIKFLLDSLSAIAALSPKDFEKVFEQLFEAKNPKALMKSPLGKYVKEYKKLIKLWMKKFKKEAQIFPEIELVFFNMGYEKASIKSPLIDEAKKLFPHKTIIVVHERGTGFSTISARRQDGKIKVNNLLEKAILHLDHSAAGGHDPAAGGIIQTNDLQQFKKNLVTLLKEHYAVKAGK